MKQSYDMVVIGGSSGSMKIIKHIVKTLRSDLNTAIIVVYHIHPDSGDIIVKNLNESTSVSVKQAIDKDKIEPGVVYFAPPNYHLLIEPDESLSLSVDEPVNYSRPSIDVLFESAAEVYGNRLIGVILSGANTDGSIGMKHIKDAGGLVVIQTPESAEMDMMPSGVLAATSVDHILNPDDIGEFLNGMMK